MRKLLLLLFAFISPAMVMAQAGGLVNATRGFPQPQDQITGVVQYGTAIINSSGNAIAATTSNTTVKTYIVLSATSAAPGNANLAMQGSLAPCTMDGTIASGGGNYFVINSATTSGECHAQSAAPSANTWIIGYLHDSTTISGNTALVEVNGFFYPPSTAGTGTVNAVTDWTGTTTLGSIPCVVSNTLLTGINGSPPACTPSGIALANGGAVVSSCPYTVAPDTATATVDRGTHLVINSAGACAVTLQDPTVSGMANNFTLKISNIGAGVVTVSHSTSATFDVLTGSSAGSSLGANSFTLNQYQWTVCDTDNSSVWYCDSVTGGVTTVSNSDSSLTISPTAGAVVASINVANANTWSAAQSFTNTVNMGSTATTVNSSGLVTKYNGMTTAGQGTIVVLGELDATGVSTANSGSPQNVLASTPAAGFYMFNVYMDQNAVCATVGPGALAYTMNWTDPSHARQTTGTTFTVGTSQANTAFANNTFFFWATSGSAVTITFTYTACSSGTWTYDFHANVSRIF